MESKKKKTKASSKIEKQTQKKAKPPPARKADQERHHSNPTPSPPSTPGAPTSDLHPAVALIVSLLAPGLGLLLLHRRDRVQDAFLIFGLWFGYVALSFVLTFFVIGMCCWLPLPLLHVAAGIHSFDEMTLERGGKPVLFQTSFRFFQD